MKKLNTFLNILMGTGFGVFIGTTLANYREYRTFPEIYEIRSAPWYCYGTLTSFLLFIVISLICIVLKLLIRNKTNRE